MRRRKKIPRAAQQLLWTNSCYKKALLDVYKDKLSQKEKKMRTQDIVMLIRFDWREEIKPEVNDLYRKHICQMSSKRLSAILKFFQEGKQKRAQTTIDAIMTELFERSAKSETSNNHE
jgi:hypothetical protein